LCAHCAACGVQDDPVDDGKIMATIEMPSRHLARSVVVRFRHPKAVPLKNVMVNGQRWTGFNKDKEIIELTGLAGKVAVAASYYRSIR
jgi:hypothetical protein